MCWTNLKRGKVVTVDTETNKLRRVEVSGIRRIVQSLDPHGHATLLSIGMRKLGFEWQSARHVYRGRYGYQDRNLTTILDEPEEYAPGYRSLAPIALATNTQHQQGFDWVSENAFDEKDGWTMFPRCPAACYMRI